MRRIVYFLLPLSFCLACCSQAGSRHTSGSTLVFSGLAGEPDSLNPMFSNEADELNFSHLYMSYLIENDDRGNAVGEIAREVPSLANGGISRDERTITYHLRPGLRWQDGAPLTARDVVFSYRVLIDPRNAVATRVGYQEVEAIRATDPLTVVIRLRRRFSPFAQYFFGPQGVGALIPAHLLEATPVLNHAAYNERPIGSGPYRIVEWRHADSITLASNEYYWRGKPRIDRLIYRIVPDPNTRLEQLRTGEADAYFDVDPQLLPQARTIPGVRIALTPVNDLHVLRFNLRDPTLRDARVRRAIAMAIDRQTLLAAATHGSGILVDADQPSNGWAYDPSTPPIPFDPTRARRLLGGATPEITLAISPQIINGSQLVAAVVQENLHRIGIRAIVKQYPSAMMYGPANAGGVLAGGRFTLSYDGWWVLGSDPDDSWNMACSQRPPAGLNYSFWCDPRADAAIRDALANVDRKRRKTDYAIVQRAIVAQLPILTLWQVRIPDAYRTYVHGIAPAPFGSTFWNAWSWTISSN
ncbi:MAG TPA: ABC transporter substrate-binding protein [Candidatus Babeliales bacterium]|nr:ABC transporter substrate-binding protein [Candidatus Babeliales bacterium]